MAESGESSGGVPSELEKVLTFLRHRGVENEVVNRFKEEKMDCQAINYSTETVLEEMGLTKKGDIFALKAMCSQQCSLKLSEEKEIRKKHLLEEIIKGRQNKNPKNEKKNPAADSSKQKRKTRRISLGWMHFNTIKGKYVSIRSNRGGGTRVLDVPVNMSRNELIDEGKDCFFKNGTSTEGNENDMKFDLVNFKGEIIDSLQDKNGNKIPFTVQSYFEIYKLSRVQIYLASKVIPNIPVKDPEDESIEERLHAAFGIGTTSSTSKKGEKRKADSDVDIDYKNSSFGADIRKKGEMWRREFEEELYGITDKDQDHDNQGSNHVLLGTSSERDLVKLNQDHAYNQSLAADKEKEAEKVKKLRQEVETLNRLEELRQSRMKRVPPEPVDDCDAVKICVMHSTRGRVARFFPCKENMNTVYDWVGSLSIYPENFQLTIASVNPEGAVQVLPYERVSDYHEVVLHMKEENLTLTSDNMKDDEVSFKGLGTYDGNEDPMSMVIDNDNFSIDPVNDKVPDQILKCDSTGDLKDKQIQMSEQAIASTMTQTITKERKPLRHRRIDVLNELSKHLVDVTVDRNSILATVLSLYEDVSFCHTSYPSFRFLREEGEDLDGLKREFFSAFWQKAFLAYFEGGAGTFVPRTSPDVTEHTMVLLGRIAAHGYILCKIFPVHICKCFVIATICGPEAVSKEDLLSSFMEYHTEFERQVLEKAMNYDTHKSSFPSDLQDDLLNVLESYNVRQIPNPTTLLPQLTAIANCEFIQKVSWAAQSFKKGLEECHQIWEDTVREDIDYMYADLIPTPASVLALLHIEDDVEAQMTSSKKVVLGFLKRFIRNADKVNLKKILRFITGSELVIVDRIQVVFHGNVGKIPEIISHTCAAVIDLPSSGYLSYNDFKEQLSNVLNNPYAWEFTLI